jgi:hypothetical protein
MTEIKANIDEEFVEGISYFGFITHSRILDIERLGENLIYYLVIDVHILTYGN